jgi:dihydroflavonol-4-reductase
MIFVTGGTGFVGSYLLYELSGKNKKIRAMKRAGSQTSQTELIFNFMGEKEGLSETEISQRFKRIDWIEGDILDVTSLPVLMEDVTDVFHSAGKVSFKGSEKKEIIRVNVLGTANIVNAAIESNVKNFVHISSVAALNRIANQETNETFDHEGKKFSSLYSESKYRAEVEAWRGSGEGLNMLIVNPAIVIGPCDFNKESSGKLFTQVYKGLKFQPSGGNAFVDARDVAGATIALWERRDTYGQRYIIGGHNVLYSTLFKSIAKHLNVKAPGLTIGRGMAYMGLTAERLLSLFKKHEPILTRGMIETMTNRYYYSNQKLIDMLNGYEFIPLEKSIKESCEALKKQFDKAGVA